MLKQLGRQILLNRGLRYWFPYYMWQYFLPREKPDPRKPIHILVCVADHFEPFNGQVDYTIALKRVKTWLREYPKFADRHRDSEGKPIQHTWFYPPHLDHRLLPYLVELCQAGYGDIEMHLHHNHMEPFPDTSQTLRDKILKCIDAYSKYGIFEQSDGEPRFGFIHGDWSLDNSGGDNLCGVNDELTILRECGCYADFTFPCINKCQPAMVNCIFYAIDNPLRPKSYNKGIEAEVMTPPPTDGLMLIQGVLGIRYDSKKKFRLAIEYSDLDVKDPPRPERIDYWVKNAITLKGEPNWKFIKLHTHGAPEVRWSANFGKSADLAFSYLEEKYKNRDGYVLHYVAARELYNVVSALVHGKKLPFRQMANLFVKPYPYR